MVVVEVVVEILIVIIIVILLSLLLLLVVLVIVVEEEEKDEEAEWNKGKHWRLTHMGKKNLKIGMMSKRFVAENGLWPNKVKAKLSIGAIKMIKILWRKHGTSAAKIVLWIWFCF